MNQLQFWNKNRTAVLRVDQLLGGPNACKWRVITVDPDRADRSYARARSTPAWATPRGTREAAEAQLKAYAEQNKLEPYEEVRK